MRNGVLISIAALTIGLAPCVLLPGGAVQAVTSSTSSSKSLREWAVCDGVTDDHANFKRALAAAKNSAFKLNIDCHARLKFGMDISRSIFIDNGTKIEFTGQGKLTIDNVMIPAFVIANSHDVELIDWNVEYDAGLPIDGNVGGYVSESEFFEAEGTVQPAGAFSEFSLTPWLAANRGVKFRGAYSLWRGGIIPMAVILLSGDTSNVTVSGMHMYVPGNAGGNRFIPLAFGFSPNFKDNQTVSAATLIEAKYIGVPHDITFSNVVLDGTYFGWLGNAQHVLFDGIESHRYGDLQDSKGEHVGGIGKWFAPPHLFYLNFDTAKDPALFNTDLQIRNVVDDGPRIGSARDKGGSDSSSGYANSLKIGCVDCVVSNYRSTRPDGLLDVLESSSVTFSDVAATYNSGFLNNLYPAWRFPTEGYKNLTFENVSVTDVAGRSTRLPIGDATGEGIVFTNVQLAMQHWALAGFPVPNILGTNNDVSVDFAIADTGTRGGDQQKNASLVVLQAAPATVKAGQPVRLAWASQEASSCTASGAWSGSLSARGSRVVKLSGAGTHEFAIRCQNSRAAFTTTLKVTVD